MTAKKNISEIVSAKESLVDALAEVVEVPTYPTVTVNPESGNLTGTFVYRVTYVTANGETTPSGTSASVTPSGEKIDITNIPISSDSRVIGRKIYRSDGTTSGGWLYRLKLLVYIEDNTTTSYTDNTLDESLGVYLPVLNTSLGNRIEDDSNFSITQESVRIGVNALSASSGYYNTAIGYSALKDNIEGFYNTAIGPFVLEDNVSGYYNLGIGLYALRHNVSGYQNIAISTQRSMENNTIGFQNIAIGDSSLTANTSGNTNISIGHSSLVTNKTGYYNVAIGNSALAANVDGYSNIAIGLSSLNNTTSNYNLGIGVESGKNISSGYNNIAIGYRSSYSLATGYSNVSIGHASLYSSTGLFNVGIGSDAGSKITSGNGNLFLGYGAGNQTGQIVAPTNTICIGFQSKTTASNRAVIGNADVVDVFLGAESGSAKLTCKTANFTTIPTSASGLSSGDIWSDGGTLKIV